MIRPTALAVLAAALVAATPAPARQALPEGSAPIALNGQDLVVRSPALDRELRLRIHLPPSGATANSPIAVVFTSRLGGDRIAAQLREAVRNSANYGVVLVTVEEPASAALSDEAWEARMQAEFAVDGEKTLAYERFVAEELIPFLKARFPHSKVVLAGMGLRGQFVLRLAVGRPDLADRYLVRSPELPEGAAAAILRRKAKPQNPVNPSVEVLFDRESLDAPGELDAVLEWIRDEGYLDSNPAWDGGDTEAISAIAQAVAGEAVVPPR